MVAENSIVWRCSGVAAMIVSTSGRKPRSSISSASSTTRMRLVELEVPLAQVVEDPAGRAHDDLGALVEGDDLRAQGRPPTIATARTPASRPAVSMSPATWRHSSRVGTRTRACTSGSSGSTSWTIGMPKASVLPVPVGLADEVDPGQRERQAQGLDGEGMLDPDTGQRGQRGRDGAEIGEAVLGGWGSDGS